jgi:menaquinone-dependent protoporphyrinogen oxidase
MRRVLVAYTSLEGQTELIAHHVARKFEDKGFLVRLIDILADRTEAGADDCEAAVIAGSVHRGSFDAELSGFIMRHGPALRTVPSAFLPVSLSAASDDRSERAAVDEIARRFVAESGWAPECILHVAGAVHDREMNFLERQILHAIVDSKGVARHPSGSTEFTDWRELDAFLADFAKRIPEPKPDTHEE